MMKNKNIKFLLLFLAFFLISFYMYFYVITEKFTVPETTQTISPINPNNTTSQTIYDQLKPEIARLIGIDATRIINLTYTGDIQYKQLTVKFDILEASAIEKLRNQLTKDEAYNKVDELFTTSSFIVKINGDNITINKALQFGLNNKKKSDYFNNKGLLDAAKYAKSVYKGVPEDEALTKYYKLTINKDFNIVPKL